MPALDYHVKKQGEQSLGKNTSLSQSIRYHNMSTVVTNRTPSLHVFMKEPDQIRQLLRNTILQIHQLIHIASLGTELYAILKSTNSWRNVLVSCSVLSLSRYKFPFLGKGTKEASLHFWGTLPAFKTLVNRLSRYFNNSSEQTLIISS